MTLTLYQIPILLPPIKDRMDHHGLFFLINLVEDQMAFHDQDAIALLFQGGVAWHRPRVREIGQV